MDLWARVAIGDPPVSFPRRRFNMDEFYRMDPLTIIPECAELFDGCVTDHTGDGRAHCWTWEQYAAMVESGILGEDERIELLEGEIVCMSPEGARHARIVNELATRLGAWMGDRAVLRTQALLFFNRVEAPRPDHVLLRGDEERYRSREAGPWDALLVVEVAESSVDVDRQVKRLKYARAAIPEYWIADVSRAVVMVHLNPVGGEYVDVRDYVLGRSFVSPALGGREVRVEDVLGPATGERKERSDD